MRKVYGTPYFSEGWALYAERVMRERGFFTDPLHELHHLDATIFRAARIIVDTSPPPGRDDVRRGGHVHERQGRRCPSRSARAEVGRYCWWPTQASSYLTGCLEILAIRRRYLDARGFAGVAPADVPVEALRDFHDTIAAAGVPAAGPRRPRGHGVDSPDRGTAVPLILDVDTGIDDAWRSCTPPGARRRSWSR